MTGFTRDERLRKEERLLRREQFKRTQRRGRRCHGRHFVVYARSNDLEWARLGITASRKVGKAVLRNRWKRRVREIFRRNKRTIPIGYDFVVIVKRPPEREPDFDTLRAELVELMNNAAAG